MFRHIFLFIESGVDPRSITEIQETMYLILISFIRNWNKQEDTIGSNPGFSTPSPNKKCFNVKLVIYARCMGWSKCYVNFSKGIKIRRFECVSHVGFFLPENACIDIYFIHVMNIDANLSFFCGHAHRRAVDLNSLQIIRTMAVVAANNFRQPLILMQTELFISQ